MAEYRLAPLSLDDRLVVALADLYHAVFSEPPYAGIGRQGVEARLWGQTAYPQFAGQAAFDEAGTLLGFAYGWHAVPGQWWYDQVQALLPEAEAARWLEDCFEFAELAVVRAARGQGIGGALHDALLAGQPQRTAILSVNPQAAPAYRLYLGRGWETVVEPTFFREGNPAVRIMGLDLSRLKRPPGLTG